MRRNIRQHLDVQHSRMSSTVICLPSIMANLCPGMPDHRTITLASVYYDMLRKTAEMSRLKLYISGHGACRVLREAVACTAATRLALELGLTVTHEAAFLVHAGAVTWA